MNKQRKIFVSGIATIAIAIPALFFLSIMIPTGNEIHMSQGAITDEELIVGVDMIVKGTITNSETVELFYGADSKTPKIYTMVY